MSKYIKTANAIYDGTKYPICTCTEIYSDLHYQYAPDVEVGDRFIMLEDGHSEKVLVETDHLPALCDEYDIVIRGHHHHFYDLERVLQILERIKEEKVFIDDTTVEKVDAVYAAIWTDKGLIYVGKMNDQGGWDLCL